MAVESLSFNIFANDRASETFRRLGLAAENAAGDVKDLGERLTKLGTGVTTARLKLDGDKEANAELDKLDIKLIRLGNKVASPDITVEGKIKALAEISAVDVALDKLNRKFGGGGGGLFKLLAGAGGGAGGLASILGSTGGIAGLGAAVAAATGVIAVGVAQVAGALAAATAGVAAFGALAIPQFSAVSKSLQQINTDTNAYERATTAASKSLALKHIRQDWADMSAPQRQAVHGIQSLGAEFGKLSAKLAPITFKVFNDGLKIANKLLPDLLPFATAAGKAIDGLLKSLDKFVTPAQQAVKPAGEMGSKLASISAIPPPTGFQKFLQTLQALSGPAITALGKGIGQIAGAVGNLLIVSASPQSIRTLSRVLGFMAATINGVAWAVNRASGNMQKWVDIAHQTASKFDEFRHDAARVFAAVATVFDQSRHMVAIWGHDVAHTFDTLRHSVAVTWHAMWAATIGDQIRSLQTIVRWFQSLPGRALDALRGLGHSLYAFGHAALTELWNGIKSVSFGILSWFGGFVGKILGFLGKLTGHSPSGEFYFAGQKMMTQLAAGIKSRAHHAANAAQAAAQRVSSGALGGDALANQALARRIFPWGADQWGPFVSLVMAESGFNRFARNPSSGAYGIAQALPPTKYPLAGQAGGGSHAGPQLSWMFSYIAQRYGNPSNAWAHELSAHWYGSGLKDGLFTRPTLIGVGERGPEMVSVTPGRSGGGAQEIVLRIEGTDQNLTTALVQALRKHVRVVAGGNVQVALGRN